MIHDPFPSIEEQEEEIREADERRAKRRQFDEGFAEYVHRRREEELDAVEEAE